VQVRQVPVALLHVEAVSHEELVWHGETDVVHGQVVDEAPVGPVEERRGRERTGRAERERLPQVVQREPGVDHVLDDEHVAARNPAVEVLEESDSSGRACVPLRAVRNELDEIERVWDCDRARQVGEEDDARLQRRDQQRLAAVVVANDLAAELADAGADFLPCEVDLADAVRDG
jgi:hypothetical protein